MEERDVSDPVLFEVAWEVANKVGGIYTVIKSKAPITVAEYGESYFMIGPFSSKNASLEVEIASPPLSHPEIAGALHSLRKEGINVVFGRWLIEGYPYVILFDIWSAIHRANEWKGDLWKIAGIPSPAGDNEMNEAIVFGYLVTWFLGEYVFQMKSRTVVAHFHEWLASVGLLLIKKRSLPICTIFTTHATLLGRFLCAGEVDFYNNLKWVNVDEEAGKRGIYHRYCLERAAAHSADVFTTVSHITAYEAEHLLKRKPDGVLPNGLNIIKFSAIHEFQNLHAENKAKINSFVQGHFYGHYNFNLDNTLYFFTAGRYEYRNKGVDLFIEALARLNAKLKHFNSPMTVVAFIIMPAATKSYTVDTLKGQAVTKQLQEFVNEIQKKIGNRIYESALKGNIPKSTHQLLSDQEIVQLKRYLFALKRESLPPIVTHNMTDDDKDPILNELRRLHLFNGPGDRVKLIFHPEFLSSNNPVLGLDYEDFVRGCHLGVFPSYYEPWGYTPAECTVMGVPSITTNLSGFGCYIEENVENPSDYGIFIIDRRLKSVEETVQQLLDYMLGFCSQSRRQRINQRNRTERLSDILDWKKMGIEYRKARLLALRRRYPEGFREFLEMPMSVEEAKREADEGKDQKIPKPLSAPSSPKIKSSFETPEMDDSVHKEATKLGQLDISDTSITNSNLFSC